eukprot:12896689-Prorocentrum_lima.AAC.1
MDLYVPFTDPETEEARPIYHSFLADGILHDGMGDTEVRHILLSEVNRVFKTDLASDSPPMTTSSLAVS